MNKRCLDCLSMALDDDPRCLVCRRKHNWLREQDEQRKARKKALYTKQHTYARTQWAKLINAGALIKCWRCNTAILDPANWDLDHGAIESFGVSLPAHSYCNRSAH